MSVNSKQELINYALRKLGGGVINISVTPEQIDDRVYEALQFYQDFHHDGTERIYLKHQITGTTIAVTSAANFIVGENVFSANNNKFIIEGIDLVNNTILTKVVTKNDQQEAQFAPLESITGQSSGATTTVILKTQGDIENRCVEVSDMVTGVIRAIPWWHVTNKSTYMFDPQYQVIMTTFQNLASSSMIYFSQLMSHIATIDHILRPIDSIRFNRKMGKIYLDFDWTQAQVNGFLIFECYRILDPEVFTEIYSDRMLKKLVTAKIKYQWATNLQLYSGIQLLGGVTVDATTLMAQAVAEIEAAETEIRTSYEEPPMGFIG
jgi:hypothetical protein